MFNPFIIKLFIIITLLLSCEHSLTDSSKKSLLSFTDVTKKAGLANFKHVSGSIGNKWFPESMGSGQKVGRIDLEHPSGSSAMFARRGELIAM